MNKYDIEIEEVLRRVITGVEAKDINEAINKVEERYDNEEIVLDSLSENGNIECYTFTIILKNNKDILSIFDFMCYNRCSCNIFYQFYRWIFI